jgi:hypothetical protein
VRSISFEGESAASTERRTQILLWRARSGNVTVKKTVPENWQLPKIRHDVLEQPAGIQSIKNGSMIAPQEQHWGAQ